MIDREALKAKIDSTAFGLVLESEPADVDSARQPLTTDRVRVTMAAKKSSPKAIIQCQLKLRPTCAQEATFRRWLWHLTGVYNWTIKTVEREAQAGVRLSAIDLKTRLNGHSAKVGIPTNVLTGTVDTAFSAWTRRLVGRSGRPRLKGRRRPLSSIALSHGVGKIANGRAFIPGIGPVRFHRQEIPAGACGYSRICRRASGWYLCLFIKAAPKPIARVGHGEVGIDPGFSSLLTLSTGEKIEHPREFERLETRMGQAQRGHHRRLSARLLERGRHQRKNRNHHLSRRLIAENTLVAFSEDRTSAIARRFGKSVSSSSHSQLRSMLRYKSLTGGATYLEVPSRNSTRACSSCGALSGPTGLRALTVRTWVCACGAPPHDRDVNAAINALRVGLGMSHEQTGDRLSGIAPEQYREVHSSPQRPRL